jgi:hypothetical protein
MLRSSPTPQAIAQWFFDFGFSDAQIALLVSAHAGHVVAKRSIVGIRTGEPGYSGRDLAPAFSALARAWNIGAQHHS